MFAEFIPHRKCADRRRGRGRRHRDRPPCRHAHRGQARRAARHAQLRAARRRRPGDRDALDQRRPRLPVGRPRARVPQGQRPRRVPRRHRSRGARRRSSCCAAPKASSPRSRAATPIAYLTQARGQARQQEPRARVPVRPRRQGSADRARHLRQGAGGSGASDEPAQPTRSRARASEKRAALVIYLCAGDPDLDTTLRVAAGRRRGRRRRDRARHAVQRSDRRRPGDSARERARAGLGHDACRTCSRPCAAFREHERCRRRAVRLLQPDPRVRRGRSSRRRPSRPASTACWSSTCRRKKPARCLPRAARATSSTSCRWSRRPRRTRASIASRASRTSFLYYVSLTGVTGAERPTSSRPAERAAELREQHRFAGRGRLRREDARARARRSRATPTASSSAPRCAARSSRARRRPKRSRACASWSAACAPRARSSVHACTH